MSSIFTHPFAGAAVAAMAETSPTAATVTVAALCAVIADADGIGYFPGHPLWRHLRP